jgi:pyruvate dehydrogenase E1 component alpha subunit
LQFDERSYQRGLPAGEGATLRKFEDKLAALYTTESQRILHLYNGQEAVLAGALHAMDLTKDKMITAYRNHVQPIGMGVDPRRVMAEL